MNSSRKSKNMDSTKDRKLGGPNLGVQHMSDIGSF